VIYRLSFDLNLVCTPGTRPLAETVWVACTRVGDLEEGNDADFVHRRLLRWRDDSHSNALRCQWLRKINTELLHVSDFSCVYDARCEMSESCRALLHRVTTLRTNQVAMAQFTARTRLVSLTIARMNDDANWIRLLPTLTGLTHIRLETYTLWNSSCFGRALAQLADAHHRLRSIDLPLGVDQLTGRCLLEDLLGHARDLSLDVSSVCVLKNAPPQIELMQHAFAAMTRLVAYVSSPYGVLADFPWMGSSLSSFDDDKNADDRLVFLELPTYDFTHPWIEARLFHLVQLVIHESTCGGLVGPYPSLQCLYTPSSYFSHLDTRHMSSIAPNLEYLSMYESSIWHLSDQQYCVLPCFASLSSLPHFQHLTIRPALWHSVGDPAILTRVLLQGMVDSPCWRHVTCINMPVTITMSGNPYTLEQLMLVRWHYIPQYKRLVISYRPRLQALSWSTLRSAFHMNSCRIVWEFV
jgi:hypothetical protein